MTESADLKSIITILDHIRQLDDEVSKIQFIADQCANDHADAKISFTTEVAVNVSTQSNPLQPMSNVQYGYDPPSFFHSLDDLFRSIREQTGDRMRSGGPAPRQFNYTLLAQPSLTLQILALVLQHKRLERIELMAQVEQMGVCLK